MRLEVKKRNRSVKWEELGESFQVVLWCPRPTVASFQELAKAKSLAGQRLSDWFLAKLVLRPNREGYDLVQANCQHYAQDFWKFAAGASGQAGWLFTSVTPKQWQNHIGHNSGGTSPRHAQSGSATDAPKSPLIHLTFVASRNF